MFITETYPVLLRFTTPSSATAAKREFRPAFFTSLSRSDRGDGQRSVAG